MHCSKWCLRKYFDQHQNCFFGNWPGRWYPTRFLEQKFALGFRKALVKIWALFWSTLGDTVVRGTKRTWKEKFCRMACLKLIMEKQNNFICTLIYLGMLSYHNDKTPVTTTMDVKWLRVWLILGWDPAKEKVLLCKLQHKQSQLWLRVKSSLASFVLGPPSQQHP